MEQEHLDHSTAKMLDDWIIVKHLGAGGYCKVKLGKHKETGQEAALKIILRNHKMERNIKAVKDELSALTQFNHPNILKTFGCNDAGV